jgi:hypothetical protein
VAGRQEPGAAADRSQGGGCSGGDVGWGDEYRAWPGWGRRSRHRVGGTVAGGHGGTHRGCWRAWGRATSRGKETGRKKAGERKSARFKSLIFGGQSSTAENKGYFRWPC